MHGEKSYVLHDLTEAVGVEYCVLKSELQKDAIQIFVINGCLVTSFCKSFGSTGRKNAYAQVLVPSIYLEVTVTQTEIRLLPLLVLSWPAI